MMKDIVIASNNKHKIMEIRMMLEPLGYNVLSMNDIGFYDEIVEDGETFKDNSFIKARAVFEKANCPVIADDSGLSVDCLNGDPGVHSHRYSMIGTDEANREKLKEELRKLNLDRYPAHFTTAMTYMDKDKTIVKEGYVYGEMILEDRGTHGFGYDPMFYLPELKKTMSELTDTEKNSISHRHNALVKLIEELR